MAEFSDPDGNVEVTVIEATKLATLGRSPFDDKFCVGLSLGDQAFITSRKSRATLKGGSKVSWNEHFTFTFVGQMPHLTLKVYGDESGQEAKETVGQTTVSYANLSSGRPLEIGVEKFYELPLYKEDDHTKVEYGKTQLKFSIKIISLGAQEQVEDLAQVLEQAELSIKSASTALDHLKGPQMAGIPENAVAVGTAAASVGSLLNKIGKVADIMSELSKIHPYAKAAWDILDLARQVIQAQVRQDASIRELFNQMNSAGAYKWICDEAK